jgi:peptide/nickel transport system substrate-binding protein
MRGHALWRVLALVFALTIVAAACGGGDDGSSGGTDDTGSDTTADAGEPVSGGRVVYGLEAETTNGWCLPEAQLAIAGIQIARTVYDTLMVLNEDGEPVPWLAESVEPNADFTQWTITLRDGVKFHDGSDLTAEVVKNNLDAYRGQYPGRTVLLFTFVFQNIESVEATGPLEVKVNMKSPWAAFPTFLWGSGRVGMIGQAQLDSADHCFDDLIGTGPFMKKDWVVNDHFTAERNPNWWYAKESGEPYPYLDEIEYRPIIGGPNRLRAFEGGEITAGHFSGGRQIAPLEESAESGDISLVESNLFTEVNYIMLNSSKPPFDNINARRAISLARNREAEVEVLAEGIGTPASGPFAQGNVGYLEKTSFPDYDLDAAKEAVAAYEDETGQPLEFTYLGGSDPDAVETAQFLQQEWQEAGMTVNLQQIADQSQLIDSAIAGNFDSIGWRNHPGGGSPDSQYVWWYNTGNAQDGFGNPVNFARFVDDEINRLLDEGRAEPDPEAAASIYEELNERFAEQLYDSWGTWTTWAIPTTTDIHGIYGPDSIDGSGPYPGLATGHPVFGIWVEGGGS